MAAKLSVGVDRLGGFNPGPRCVVRPGRGPLSGTGCPPYVQDKPVRECLQFAVPDLIYIKNFVFFSVYFPFLSSLEPVPLPSPAH